MKVIKGYKAILNRDMEYTSGYAKGMIWKKKGQEVNLDSRDGARLQIGLDVSTDVGGGHGYTDHIEISLNDIESLTKIEVETIETVIYQSL